MKVLIIFDNGVKLVAERDAMVLPYPAHQITEQIPLDETKTDKLLALEQNPNDEALLAELRTS